MASSNTDFVVNNGLKLKGYITSVGNTTPTNGQLLIGDTTNGRLALGTLAVSNGITATVGASTLSLTTTATNTNIANAIVARDSFGNFTAGSITATLVGNATTATTLQTARTINGASFDGSANITFTTDAVAEGTTHLYFTNARASAAAPVQTVAGRIGTVTLSYTDISGLGTMANQNANSVAITGGTISGVGITATSAIIRSNQAVGAAGSTQATASVTTADVIYVNSGTASTATGIVLPLCVAGRNCFIINNSGIDITVYPPSGATLDWLAANAGMTLPYKSKMEFVCTGSANWYSIVATYA